MKASAVEEARSWAAHWSQRWFLDTNGEDRLRTAEGVPAGWATHVEAYSTLLDIALAHVGAPTEPASVLRRAKAAGWDRSLRWWGLRMVARRQPAVAVERPVVFVVEIPTPSMLDPAALVAKELPSNRRVVASADPRAYRTLRRWGLDVHSMALSVKEEMRCLRAGARLLPLLDSLVASHPPMPLGGVDLGARAIRRLARSTRRSLPWIVVEHRSLLRLAEKLEPAAWAVASDQHRIGRLVAHVAGDRSVTVLQHGMPQAEIGYLPLVADRLAAWSPSAVEWFIRRGTPAARLATLGNPRLDHLARAETGSSTPPHSSLRLLLALSPSALSTNRHVLETTLAALDTLEAVDLVIKLHPGHREWGWVKQLVAGSARRSAIRIDHRGSLETILAFIDVAIVHRSTVALEALAAGIPVIALQSDLPSVADEELRDVDLPTASNTDELARAIAALRQPEARERFVRERRERVLHHAGPLDGRSAERIATVLLDDARR